MAEKVHFFFKLKKNTLFLKKAEKIVGIVAKKAGGMDSKSQEVGIIEPIKCQLVMTKSQ